MLVNRNPRQMIVSLPWRPCLCRGLIVSTYRKGNVVASWEFIELGQTDTRLPDTVLQQPLRSVKSAAENTCVDRHSYKRQTSDRHTTESHASDKCTSDGHTAAAANVLSEFSYQTHTSRLTYRSDRHSSDRHVSNRNTSDRDTAATASRSAFRNTKNNMIRSRFCETTN